MIRGSGERGNKVRGEKAEAVSIEKAGKGKAVPNKFGEISCKKREHSWSLGKSPEPPSSPISPRCPKYQGSRKERLAREDGRMDTTPKRIKVKILERKVGASKMEGTGWKKRDNEDETSEKGNGTRRKKEGTPIRERERKYTDEY